MRKNLKDFFLKALKILLKEIFQNQKQDIVNFLAMYWKQNYGTTKPRQYFVYENEPIKVESIFFTNCDKNDTAKELAILYSHKTDGDGEVIGTYYFTHFYDNINFSNPPKTLTEITTFKEIFHELEGRFDDSDFKKAKFKTASEIKNALKCLGY